MMTSDEAYDAGLYVMRAPSVCTARWARHDWIRYVTYTVPISDGYKIHEASDQFWFRRNDDE